MEDLSFVVADWWTWLMSAFYGVDRVWLCGAVIVSVLAGVYATGYIRESGFLWRAVVAVLVAASTCVLALALMQMNPTLFDAGELARSQVSL